MGLFDRIHNLFKKTEPDSVASKEYKACLEVNSNDIIRFKRYIAEYISKLSRMDSDGVMATSPIYQSVLDELKRFKYSLYESEKASKYIRKNTADDIEYRKELIVSFADKLKELLTEDSNLRFHGTPIYFAEEIFRSGGISSSADRFDGYIRSTDGRGEISVSDINSLDRTVNYFLDVTAYQQCLPCGCLFVLSADGQTYDQRASSVMNSVDFIKEPTRLRAVISTPENLQNLKKWLSDCGLSPDLAFTFDGFVSEIEKTRPMSFGCVSHRPLTDVIAAAENVCVAKRQEDFVIDKSQNTFMR